MAIGPHSPPTVLLKLNMVDETEDRLEEQQDENDDADDGVVVVEQVHGNIVDHPDADAKRSNVDEVGEELEYAVDDPYAAEGAEADEYGTEGEEEDECEGGEDAVGCDEFAAGFWVCVLETAVSTWSVLGCGVIVVVVSTSISSSGPVLTTRAILCGDDSSCCCSQSQWGILMVEITRTHLN